MQPILLGQKCNAIESYCKHFTGYCTSNCVIYRVIKDKGDYYSCSSVTLPYRTDAVRVLYNALCEHYNMNEEELYNFLMKKKTN